MSLDKKQRVISKTLYSIIKQENSRENIIGASLYIYIRIYVLDALAISVRQ